MIEPRTSNEAVQEFIAGLVNGRKVLDVGCIDHSAESEGCSTWLHRKVAKSAASCLGVDLLQNDVDRLRCKGYNMIAADATTVSLPDKYEVIVAGELIEHLDNPGKFLSNMRRHLCPEGILVLTTPNAFYGLHFVESMLMSPYKRWNSEHVSWYCYFTLENLLRRNGLYVRDCVYFMRSRKVRHLLKAVNLHRYPKFLSSTIVIVAQSIASGPEQG